jgi:hypothetical protein
MRAAALVGHCRSGVGQGEFQIEFERFRQIHFHCPIGSPELPYLTLQFGNSPRVPDAAARPVFVSDPQPAHAVERGLGDHGVVVGLFVRHLLNSRSVTECARGFCWVARCAARDQATAKHAASGIRESGAFKLCGQQNFLNASKRETI